MGFTGLRIRFREIRWSSIIIPNKDAREDLEKCVNSILTKSTYKNFEILIVENNSTSSEIFDYYKKL